MDDSLMHLEDKLQYKMSKAVERLTARARLLPEGSTPWWAWRAITSMLLIAWAADAFVGAPAVTGVLQRMLPENVPLTTIVVLVSAVVSGLVIVPSFAADVFRARATGWIRIGLTAGALLP